MDRIDPTTKINITHPESQKQIEIEQVPTVEGQRTLGVRLSPSGDISDEMNHFISKSQ